MVPPATFRGNTSGKGDWTFQEKAVVVAKRVKMRSWAVLGPAGIILLCSEASVPGWHPHSFLEKIVVPAECPVPRFRSCPNGSFCVGVS